MLTIFKRELSALCEVLVLIAVLGLVFPPFTYGKNPSPPAVEEDEDSPDQSDEHGADPCAHLPDPPGEANGIDKRCLRGGSSSGIAKGDFNGDGFGDLAVGIPFEDTSSTAEDAGAVMTSLLEYHPRISASLRMPEE